MSSKLYIKITTDLSAAQLAELIKPNEARYEQAQILVNLLQGSMGGQVAQTLSIESGAVTPSGDVTPSGVQVDDTVTIQSIVLTAKATAASEAQFTIGTTDLETAKNLRDVINANSSLQSIVTSEVNSSGQVVVDAAWCGTLGNGITLVSSSSSTLAVSGATLADATLGTTRRYKFNREV